jgi:type I restriction enzyme R subunit
VTAPCLASFGKHSPSTELRASHPKALIEAIAEDLLASFREAPLLDANEVYQHLMNYWAETMQDDAYLIAAAEPSPEYGDKRLELALAIDRVMREQVPAGWKGDQAREAQVLNALFPLLDRNRDATQALFELLKNQPGY